MPSTSVALRLSGGRPPFISQAQLEFLDHGFQASKTESGTSLPCVISLDGLAVPEISNTKPFSVFSSFCGHGDGHGDGCEDGALGSSAGDSEGDTQGMNGTPTGICTDSRSGIDTGGFERSVREFFDLGKNRFLVATVADTLVRSDFSVKGDSMLLLCGGATNKQVMKVKIEEYLRAAKDIVRADWIAAPFSPLLGHFSEKKIRSTLSVNKDLLENAVSYVVEGEKASIGKCFNGRKRTRTEANGTKVRLLIPIVGFDVESCGRSIDLAIETMKDRSYLFQDCMGLYFPPMSGASEKIRLEVIDKCLKTFSQAFPSVSHFSTYSELVASGPSHILSHVLLGVDIIQSDLAYLMTKNGNALDLSTDRICTGELNINLRDELFAKDKSPLVDGCKCDTCKKYTRGYIHHLLVCREMLAEMLLFTHNTYATMEFIEMANTLSEQDLRRLIDSMKTGASNIKTTQN